MEALAPSDPEILWERNEGSLRCLFLGRVEYEHALALQERLIERSRAGQDHLLLLEHPPVYTTGRTGDEANLPADPGEIPVVRTGRGGDATYHGPGQLVGYPIIALGRRHRDIHRYLRDLECGLIDLLDSFRISAHTERGRTGVWVTDRREADAAKIASIGIAVRRSVAWHGFALNVAPEIDGFNRIIPCGLAGVRMTSMAQVVSGPPPRLDHVASRAAETLGGILGKPLEA